MTGRKKAYGKMKIKRYNYGDYFQKLFLNEGKILDASCTCTWGEVHKNAWKSGEKLCKHIVAAMREHELEMKNKNKKLTKKIKGGYFYIYKPKHKYSLTKKGWILEHRAIVEDFIKRELKTGECIHHINSKKKDNGIENLMVFNNHREHSSFHTKIKQFGMTNPVLKQIENRWKKYIKLQVTPNSKI